MYQNDFLFRNEETAAPTPAAALCEGGLTQVFCVTYANHRKRKCYLIVTIVAPARKSDDTP